MSTGFPFCLRLSSCGVRLDFSMRQGLGSPARSVSLLKTIRAFHLKNFEFMYHVGDIRTHNVAPEGLRGYQLQTRRRAVTTCGNIYTAKHAPPRATAAKSATLDRHARPRHWSLPALWCAVYHRSSYYCCTVYLTGALGSATPEELPSLIAIKPRLLPLAGAGVWSRPRLPS